jgi:hypothetical protein
MAVTYQNNGVVRDGLIFCLDAANQRSYPGSGTTATDLSSNISTTLQSSGMFENTNRGVFNFDGSTNYIEIINNAQGSIFAVQTFTISIWFKSEVDPDTKYQMLWSCDYSEASQPYYSQHISIGGAGSSSDEMFFNWNNGSSYRSLLVNGALTGRQLLWNNVTVTFTSGEQKLYLNGIERGSNNLSDTISYFTEPIYIGKNYSPAFYQGDISHTSFYNRTLSSQEVSKNYNELKGRFE